MTSFLSLDGKIAAWSSSFQSTPKKPDEAMRVLEGKAFELDVRQFLIIELYIKFGRKCLCCLLVQGPICQRMIHMLLDMAVDTSESVRPPCRQFGEVLVKFWSLRGLKTFKMMKIGVVAGENHDHMVAAKRRCHCGRPSPDEASRG
ncbi:unnamed protein product [Brassica rapa]|uniref:Uncharacterized protein n=1 Tax=Brassica campestris TaxID=3711 RepID=A0A8D9GTU6_BRACM|nr:unnamed protein product [Brassica rapa]